MLVNAATVDGEAGTGVGVGGPGVGAPENASHAVTPLVQQLANCTSLHGAHVADPQLVVYGAAQLVAVQVDGTEVAADKM